MTEIEMLQFQIGETYWGKLKSLTDSELMTRRHAEMEMQKNLKWIKKEMNRRYLCM